MNCFGYQKKAMFSTINNTIINIPQRYPEASGILQACQKISAAVYIVQW
jgi:hypothetical protein